LEVKLGNRNAELEVILLDDGADNEDFFECLPSDLLVRLHSEWQPCQNLMPAM
jgi:hypothetical protein